MNSDLNAARLPSFACGDFMVSAEDGSKFCGRSMEFLSRQYGRIVTFNRDEPFESIAPDNTKGLTWRSNHGFTGITAFNDGPVEGLNEAGLSFGVLTLEETEYQTVGEDQKDRALALLDVGKWILGSFATVAEVKEALPKVLIWGQVVEALNKVPGLHIALHDAQGNNGVIELIGGKVNFYENPKGVLTNDPELPWQLKNLEQYEELIPDITSKDPKEVSRGMLGLPGDWSPISRFVRIWMMTNTVKPKDGQEAFSACTHILNATDIPSGVVVAEVANEILAATTLWATIKDLKNRVFYYRPHGDTTFRAIYLKKVPLIAGTNHPSIPVHADKPTIIDVTGEVSKESPSYWPGLHWLIGGSSQEDRKDKQS